MPSTFTWLDYSEHERRRMMDVIALFGEKTTRDELGLGGVRDAFADLLFPGTSTVQTRAKYFLFIPWIYLSLEKKGIRSAQIGLRGRKLELELARQLEESGETEGVIGLVAKEQLQRLPSNIYWQGLRLWGIRTFPGSQDEYHRSLDRFYGNLRSRQESHFEYDGESAEESDQQNWHVGLPHPGAEFPAGSSLALRRHEASYLRERLLTSCPQSLMAYIVRERVSLGDSVFAWELNTTLPDHLQTEVLHARNFSESMHGGQLLYNLLLAEKKGLADRIEFFREQIDAWDEVISARRSELQQWDGSEFWRLVSTSNPKVSSRAKEFINRWIKLVLSMTGPAAITQSNNARQLIETREFQLKRGLARMKSDRAIELWSGSAGAAQLDFRWASARRIVADILAGLEAHSDA